MQRFSIIVVALLLCGASLILAAPQTTQPGLPPATQPATAPATQPAALPTFSEIDLRRQLSVVRPGGVVRVTPGIYVITNTILLNAAGTYDLTGVELRAQHGTALWIRGSGVHLIGVTFNSPFPCTRPQGQNPKVGVAGVIVQASDVWIVNATWRNVDYCISLFPGQRYLTLVNPTFTDEIRGDALYCGGGDERVPRGDVVWIGGSVANSQQEQNIRCSTIGFSHLECYGVTFRNTNGKECFGFRIGHNAKLVDCTFWGRFPTFVGTGLPQPLENCGNITFDHCHFMDGPIDIRFCKDVKVLDCDFHSPFIPVTVSDGQNVTVKGIRRILPARDERPFFKDGSKSGNVITDLGEHAMRVIAPTTQRTMP